MWTADPMVGRLRVRQAGPDTPTLRLALARHLGAADLTPRGMPPREILILRRLEQRLPGAALQEHGTGGQPRFNDELASGVGTGYTAARRPHLGRVPENARAVLFNGADELLACLALDMARGNQGRHWWWTTVLQRLDPEARNRLAALLGSHPRELPGAVLLLDQWGHADTVLMRLNESEAEALAKLVATTFHLTGLPSPESEKLQLGTVNPARSRTGDISSARAATEREPIAAADVNGARSAIGPEPTPVADVNGARAATEREPIPAAHGEPAINELSSEPASTDQEAAVGAASIGPQALRLLALCRRVALGHSPARRQHAAPAESAEAQLPESNAGTESKAIEPAVKVRQRAATSELPARHEVAAPVFQARPVRHQARAIPTPAGSPARGAADPPSATGLQPATEDRSVDATSSLQGRGLDAGEPASGAQASFPVSEAQTGQRTSEPKVGPIARDPESVSESGLPTALGGVLYLIHLLRTLDLSAGHPADLGTPVGVSFWGLLELVGRVLTVTSEHQADPVWSLLAGLDGRPEGRLPTTSSPPRRDFRLPASWRVDLIDSADAIRWWTLGGRFVVWSGDLLILDGSDPGSDGARRAALSAWGVSAPAQTDSPPSLPALPATLDGLAPGLVAWLRRLLPALHRRLQGALGLTPGDSAGIERHLLRCAGTLYLTRTHLDLVAELDQISLPVRRAGLDRDPGWLPELGIVVSFHYR